MTNEKWHHTSIFSLIFLKAYVTILTSPIYNQHPSFLKNNYSTGYLDISHIKDKKKNSTFSIKTMEKPHMFPTSWFSIWKNCQFFLHIYCLSYFSASLVDCFKNANETILTSPTWKKITLHPKNNSHEKKSHVLNLKNGSQDKQQKCQYNIDFKAPVEIAQSKMQYQEVPH